MSVELRDKALPPNARKRQGGHSRVIPMRPFALRVVRSSMRPWRRRIVPSVGGSYTPGMKTAVSLPDDLFAAADRHAEQAGKSRSQLYAEAIAEYLDRRAPEEITEAMNRVVDRLPTGADPFVEAAARAILGRVEW